MPRRLLSLCLVALAAFAMLSLTACCGDGVTMRSPFVSAKAPPEVVPTQWGVVQQTQAVGIVQSVQPVGVCAPAPAGVCAPAGYGYGYYAAPAAPAPQVPYTPGYSYAAPPAGCTPGVGR
jgi:hypothetical protein